MWAVYDREHISVVPLNDIYGHEPDDTTCHCQPTVDFSLPRILIVHNSFDGREFQEPQAIERK